MRSATAEDVLDGLNPSQRQAAMAVRGPVCILAGAGSGKTTTITRRIAHQVASGAFRPDELLAITFTDRAANEMRTRLGRLGVGGVRARTFHAEALAQVAHFSQAPELMPSKGSVVYHLVRRLPKPYRFRATKDVAAEIEWAKNRRITPERYPDEVDGRAAPLPPDLMARVYGNYEAAKRREGKLDFEDLLEAAIALLRDRPDVADRVRGRYRAFTVDEYQDVNLLQQTLLDAWLGGRDEVCAVGDDHQSIYGFTGATHRYLLGFRERHPGAKVFTLEENYRSTPQVLGVANRLSGRLGGTRKTLRATTDEGPEPDIREYPTGDAETLAIVEAVEDLARDGVPYEEMAVLYRINARSEDYEEAFARARIPYQVRDGSFLRRPGPRAVLRVLRSADPDAPAAWSVEAAARNVGWDPDAEPEGAEEATRQADLTRLVHLAEEAGATVGGFVEDLRARFEGHDGGRGVVLSTYHRAKGLEWDAVFLPRLEERELPFALAKADEDVAEERRLLYVGITRARRHLWLGWARSRDGKSVRPSRFVREIAPDRTRRTPEPSGPKVRGSDEPPSDPELFQKLREWRKETADAQEVPAYVVFHDATLRAICDLKPRSLDDLARVAGVGPTKLARYGSDVLTVVAASG